MDDLEKLTAAIQTVLRGFDDGVFVRDTSRDGERGWAVRMLPFIAALGTLKEYSDSHGA